MKIVTNLLEKKRNKNDLSSDNLNVILCSKNLPRTLRRTRHKKDCVLRELGYLNHFQIINFMLLNLTILLFKVPESENLINF